jgi:hypothetical protein
VLSAEAGAHQPERELEVVALALDRLVLRRLS